MGGPLDRAKPSLKGNKGFGSCFRYGTGYSVNLKPAVYYSPRLDFHDNPNLGFQSQTKSHYKPWTAPSGAETLPNTRDNSRESGYLQLHSHPRPKLSSYQTEYKSSYFPQRPILSVYRKHHTVGAKEESGFTIGNSLQDNILLPQDTSMGNEVLPKLFSKAPRQTAFTRDTLEPLACPDSLQVCSRGHSQKSPLFAEKTIGRKEDSGFVLNTPILKTLSDTSYDPLQFLSHYHTQFCNTAGLDALKAGWNRGVIHKHRDSGYSGRDRDRFNLRGY